MAHDSVRSRLTLDLVSPLAASHPGEILSGVDSTPSPDIKRQVDIALQSGQSSPDTSGLCIRVKSSSGDSGLTTSFSVDKLSQGLREAIEVKVRKSMLKQHSNTFVASEAIDWLRMHAEDCLPDPCPRDVSARPESWPQPSRKKLSRGHATLLAEKLLEAGVFWQISGNTTTPFQDRSALFRFHEDTRLQPVLNGRKLWYSTPRMPLVVVTELLQRALRLDLANPHLRDTAEFRDFVEATAELQVVKVDLLRGSAESTCFFLNAFNLCVIHGHISLATQNLSNLKPNRRRFLRACRYIIGGYTLSLKDVQRRLMGRVNGTSRITSRKPTPPEPRIHFALSLGALSSPRVLVYAPATLSQQLDAAAKDYCTQYHPVEFRAGHREVILPKVFRSQHHFGSKADTLTYYSKFVPEGSREKVHNLLHSGELKIIEQANTMRYLSRYVPKEQQSQLHMLLLHGDLKIKYRSFDWRVSYEKMANDASRALAEAVHTTNATK
eukprot:CAMPEP_0175877646 /NCGR_PEP_ID=MMETSP0107_2-20121207/40737_1 /TAXON_ID=195067 ORGANISM="Goniomonas pacifica, Strain CCMP1869" /NCGR_SAMPLE_ID=MMETSP0107_2 /ASSEMBLY_ACC=CAM_ASM_000203 /LENGTH=494 /DNA_ID=CAMNT_0017197021 /DNA_START=1 /DNA_END=1485 /DNA_ORIENTATION=-